MIKSKLLKIFTALSITAGLTVPYMTAYAGTVNFTDDLSDDTKLFSKSDEVQYIRGFSDSEFQKPYENFYTLANTVDSGYVIYKTDGDICGFSIDVIGNNYANNAVWRVYLSEDGESWVGYEGYNPSDSTAQKNCSPLIPDLDYRGISSGKTTIYYQGTSGVGSDANFYHRMRFSLSDGLEAGMSYLKIEFPQRTGQWGNKFARALTDVSIDYITGFSAAVENGQSVSAGQNSFTVSFTKPVFCSDSSWIRVLSGSGDECAVENTVFSPDNKSCTVTLAENLEEDEYKVLIGSSLKDEAGYGCNTPNLSFRAEYPGAAAQLVSAMVNSMLPEFVIVFDREMNDISASDITVTGADGREAAVKSTVMSEDKKSCTVTAEDIAEGEYTVYIGDNVTDTEGNSVKTAYRRLKITVFVPGESAELEGGGVIGLSEKKVTILFSGVMNSFGREDIIITKDNIAVDGFEVSMAADKKSAAVTFSELAEGTYYIDLTDNVTDASYNVPVIAKYRRLEFTAAAERTAVLETPDIDYEEQTLKLIFSHEMDPLSPSLIKISSVSGAAAETESIVMAEDGLSCVLKLEKLPEGEYKLELSDKYYDRVGYGISPSCRTLGFKITDYGTAAMTEKAEVKAADNAVTVVFAEEIAQIDASMITVRDSFENEVVVTGIEMSADGRSCRINFAALSDDSYTIYLGSGIRTVSDHTVHNSCRTLVFTAADDREGKRILKDDFGYAKGAPDISKIYSASDEVVVRTTSGFTAGTIATSTGAAEKEKRYSLTAGPGLISPYVVYRTEGIISEFSIDVMYWGVSSNIHDGKYSFYVSDDGESWTALSTETEYSEGSAEKTNYDPNWYRKTYKSTARLDGHNANYIKICYPTRGTGGSNTVGWGARSITNVQLSYNYGAGSAKVRETGTQENGKSFYADIAFMNPIDESSVNPGYFTIENSDVKCYSVSYDSVSRVLRLFFDKALEFSKEYTLKISDEFTDEYGFGLAENSKSLALSFSEPDIVVINTENPFNTSEITAGCTVTCKVNLTANYAGGEASQKITMAAVMTRDGRICAIASDSRVLDVGSSADFSAELKAPTNITAREEVSVRVYIIDSWQGLRLLSDRIMEL